MILREDLHRIDFSDIASGETLPPVTPGDILSHEFMRPLGLSARALARDLGCPANRITGIVNGTRAITAATATFGAAGIAIAPAAADDAADDAGA